MAVKAVQRPSDRHKNSEQERPQQIPHQLGYLKALFREQGRPLGHSHFRGAGGEHHQHGDQEQLIFQQHFKRNRLVGLLLGFDNGHLGA